jgi:hypothetical protein
MVEMSHTGQGRQRIGADALRAVQSSLGNPSEQRQAVQFLEGTARLYYR